MTERVGLPLFVREAFEGDAGAPDVEPFALEEALGALLVSDAPVPSALRPELLERLQSTLEALPHRYAPFYGRLAELFDISEDAAIAEVDKLKDPKAWRFAGLPGIHNVIVGGGPRVQGAEAVFARCQPGTYFPMHRHRALERVLMLEGSYTDSDGVCHRAGELREWREGTQHSFRVCSDGCVLASVVFGRRFASWPLRTLARLLGRDGG